MLRKAKDIEGDNLEIEWRYLSLEQINTKEANGWRIWDQPSSYPMRSRWAFRGAEAARKQGNDAFERFHLNLLKARHVDRKELTTIETIYETAEASGLDLDRFKQDFEEATIDQVGVEHQAGVEKHGVFGTPTLGFNEEHAGYLKLRPLPPDDELGETWKEVKALIYGRPEIGEIKRPVPKRDN